MQEVKYVFNEKDLKKKKLENRWVKFAIGPNHFIDIENINSGIVEYFNNKISEHHKHDIEETIHVLRGTGKIDIDGNIYNIKKGDYIYIPKGMAHSVYSDDKVRLKILFIFLEKNI